MKEYLIGGAALLFACLAGWNYVQGVERDKLIAKQAADLSEARTERDTKDRDLKQAQNAIRIEEKVIVKTEKIYVHAKELARGIPKPQKCEDIGAMLRAQHDAITRVRLHYAQISDLGPDRDRNPPEAPAALQRP